MVTGLAETNQPAPVYYGAGSRFNADPQKLREPDADGRNFEVLFERVLVISVRQANADRWNIEAQWDIDVGAGGIIMWLDAQPAQGLGRQLDERRVQADLAYGTFSQHFNARVQTVSGSLFYQLADMFGQLV
jgi:hypothetical protein